MAAQGDREVEDPSLVADKVVDIPHGTVEAVLETDPNTLKEESGNTEETPAEAVSDAKERKTASDEKKDDGKPSFDRYKKGTQRPYTNFKNNIKTDYSILPETSDPDEIRKQVDFYFSDSNLAYDDYMRSLVVDDNDNNKTVPISKIHSFKRMKRFQPYSAVVAALKESTVVEVIGDEIRRRVAWEKPVEDTQFGDPSIPRSIYAKGFGDEGKTTQFDIESLFTPYGPINGVRLRRGYPDRVFKGSVFVEFESEELAKQFLELEEKPKWQGKELLIKSKQVYCDEKLADIEAGKLKPHNKYQYKQYIRKDGAYDNKQGDRRGFKRDSNGKSGGRRDNNGHRGDRRGNNRGRGGDRDGDRDDWKSRRNEFQKGGYRERNEGAKLEKPEAVDANGVPTIQATKATDENAPPASPSRKHARDEEEKATSQGKKAKTEIEAS